MLPNAETARGKADRESKAKIVEDLAAGFSPPAMLAAIIRDRGVLNASGLVGLSQMDKKGFTEGLAELSREPERYGLLEFGAARNFISIEAFDRVTRSILRILHAFHAKYPELAGLDAEKVSGAMDGLCGAGRIKDGDFKALAGLMAERNAIVPIILRGKTCYRAADFSRSLDSRLLDMAGRIKAEAEAAGFNLLKLPELEARLGLPYPDLKRAAAYLREQEELWMIEGELLLTREIRDRLVKILASMQGEITVAALRDAAGTNRKLSLAMLDFMDLQGLTRRDGDKRMLAEQDADSVS
jgi:selenocysteine-specific elongation factor